MPQTRRRGRSLVGGRLLTLAGFAAIALATLHPTPGASPRLSPWCLVCGESGALDVLNNIVLFMPFGAGLGRVGLPRAGAFALIIATTLGVELAQYWVITGREGTVSDVLTNTFGGGIGILLGPRLGAALFPPRRLARIFAGVSAAVLTALWLAMAFALQRMTPTGTYDAQWAPTRPRLDPFPGQVRSVVVNARPAPPSERIPAARLAADSMVRVDAWIVPGPPPERTAAIAIVERGTDEVAFLGQRAGAVVFGTRIRASDWRLKTPRIVLDNAIPASGEPGTEPSTADVRVAGVRTRRTLAVEAEWRDGSRRWSIDVTPSLGWVLLLPFDYSLRPGYRMASAAWVAALLAPLGYWSAAGARDVRAQRRSRGVMWLVPVTAIVVGLAIIPSAFGYARSHWSEWAAAFAGAAGGWALFRAADGLWISRAE